MAFHTKGNILQKASPLTSSKSSGHFNGAWGERSLRQERWMDTDKQVAGGRGKRGQAWMWNPLFLTIMPQQAGTNRDLSSQAATSGRPQTTHGELQPASGQVGGEFSTFWRMGWYQPVRHLIGNPFFLSFFFFHFGEKTFFQKNMKGYNSGLKSVTLDFFFFVLMEETINSISQ